MLNTKGQSKSNKSVAKNSKLLPKVKVRRLKVSYLSTQGERRSYDTWENRNKVPFLKLSGQWLEDAGFPISCNVNIIVKDNLLVIEPVNELSLISQE